MSGTRETERPLIAAIIPCYNGARYLADAIESVLSQTYRPLEVIVIDDGSTDGTPDVIRSFGGRIRSDRQRNVGVAAARNHGVRLATARFLSFLDADDLWPADKLRLQMAALESDTSLGLVTGYAEQFVSPELPEVVRSRFAHVGEVLQARVAGAMLVRREDFERVGEFSAGLATGETIDWFLRAAEAGVRGVVLSNVVLRRRIHTTNHGILQRDTRGDYIRIIKSALDRRREKARRT